MNDPRCLWCDARVPHGTICPSCDDELRTEGWDGIPDAELAAMNWSDRTVLLEVVRRGLDPREHLDEVFPGGLRDWN